MFFVRLLSLYLFMLQIIFKILQYHEDAGEV